MTRTLQELATLVGGTFSGDPNLPIGGAAILRDAQPGEITLAEKAGLASQLAKCQAVAVVVPLDYSPEGIAAITVADVHAAFSHIVQLFRPRRPERKPGISPHARIATTAKLGPEVNIHAGALIEDNVEIGARATIHAGVRILAGSRVGDDTIIFPNAVLYEETIVGPRCIIHANAVLGAYGFGYKTVEGRHRISAQLGNVVLEAEVEIGAGTTIDRGSYGPTVVREGTKIDNQVMIGHNCRIGRHNLLCSHVGIAGSTTTGDYVVMGGQAGVRDHVQIGNRASLGAKSGVKSDVPDGAYYMGVPATPELQQLALQAALGRLPELRRHVKEMQKQIEELKQTPGTQKVA